MSTISYQIYVIVIFSIHRTQLLYNCVRALLFGVTCFLNGIELYFENLVRFLR